MPSKKPTPTTSDISRLKSLLSATDATVLAPGDEGYNNSIARWSRAADKPAAVAVEPTNAEQVSIVVRFAAENGFDLAVRGGGHSTAGRSSTDGGVLINLARMRHVRVDEERQLLYVQGGALWMDVDAAAWKYGLATVGGTVSDTGVGGLTLGGGYGMLSGRHGLVIDNVKEMTTVVASGKIEKSSKEENPDLFWALLGAGQNFGVTTEFVLQAYPQKEAFVGTFTFEATPETIPKIVAAANNLYEFRDTANGRRSISNGRTNNFMAILRPPPLEGKSAIWIMSFFDGPEAEGREVFKELYNLNPIDCTMQMSPYPKANQLFPSFTGMRSSMKGAGYFLPIRAEFFLSMLDKFNEFMDKNPDAAASGVAWELYDPSTVVSKENGTCSFANRGYHLNGLVLPIWTKPENDAICRQWARDMSNHFKQELQNHGAQTSGAEGEAGVRGKKGAVMLYGNYDQYNEVSKDVFGDHYAELQKIKAKFDPGNLFDKLFPITPQAATANGVAH